LVQQQVFYAEWKKKKKKKKKSYIPKIIMNRNWLVDDGLFNAVTGSNRREI